MKNIGKLVALGAVLAASASFAFGDTIVAASYGLNVPYNPPGPIVTSGNSAMHFGGAEQFATVPLLLAAPVPTPTSSFPSGTPGTAFDLNPNAPATWSAALPGSSWVGYTATAGPVGTVDPPYGYYEFSTVLTNAISGGTLNLMADDTTEVFLGNTLIVSLGALGGDGHCADNKPTCSKTDSVGFSAAAGSTLTFIVEQAGLTGQTPNQDPSGVDFNITTTPEPSSLVLLGTGLLGAAGMLFRRRVTA